MKIIKRILLLPILTLLFLSTGVNAQDESYIKDRWTINASVIPDLESFGRTARHEFKLSAHYGVNKFLESGLYIGNAKYFYLLEDNNLLGVGDKILYGVSAKAHILPFLITSNDFRFDLYLNSRIGIDQFTGNPNSTYSNARFRFHGGAGLAFYPFRHLGLFTEYGYDNHGIIDYIDRWSWEFGLIYKFRGKRQ